MSCFYGGSATFWWCFQLCVFDPRGFCSRTNFTDPTPLTPQALKPVALTEQTPTVTGGSRNKPQKDKVEKVSDQVVFPALKGDSYLLAFQFKAGPSAKAVTARIEFDASACSGCQQAAWLCKCPPAKDAKKPAAPAK